MINLCPAATHLTSAALKAADIFVLMSQSWPSTTVSTPALGTSAAGAAASGVTVQKSARWKIDESTRPSPGSLGKYRTSGDFGRLIRELNGAYAPSGSLATTRTLRLSGTVGRTSGRPGSAHGSACAAVAAVAVGAAPAPVVGRTPVERSEARSGCRCRSGT